MYCIVRKTLSNVSLMFEHTGGLCIFMNSFQPCPCDCSIMDNDLLIMIWVYNAIISTLLLVVTSSLIMICVCVYAKEHFNFVLAVASSLTMLCVYLYDLFNLVL